MSTRAPGLCNFLDAPELESFLTAQEANGEKLRVVYRNYATLYFVFVVDSAESELGILDLIQVSCMLLVITHGPGQNNRGPKVFVESLDRTFENVCELDLVFHFDEVRMSANMMPASCNSDLGPPYTVGSHSRRSGTRDECRRD